MATLNAAATLEQATDFGADYATATILILDGATTLASHSTTSWTPTNSGANGVATAVLANAGAETILADGTANSATITAAGKTITLSVGLSGSDLNLSTLTYVTGETSTISSLVVTFPAA
jgi:hypothetical protein